MAKDDKERDPAWDEEAETVDKLIRQLRPAAPALAAGRSAAPRFDRPDVDARSFPPAGTGQAGVWAQVGLSILLGIALTQWPYGRACGWSLLLYLVAVATLIVAGLWGALSSWKRRLGLAHIVAMGAILWGLALAAHEVLPRVGYAKTQATWSCAEPRAAAPGSPQPEKRGA